MDIWYLYILECSDKTLYTGIAKDIQNRFLQHMAGKGAKYTRIKGVEKLLYVEKCGGQADAMKREREIKRWDRQKKLSLIKGLTT